MTVRRRAALKGVAAAAAAAALFCSRRSRCFWSAGDKYAVAVGDDDAAGVMGEVAFSMGLRGDLAGAAKAVPGDVAAARRGDNA